MNFAFPGRRTFRTRPPGKTRHQTAPRKPRQRTQEAGEPGVRETGLMRGRDGGGGGASAGQTNRVELGDHNTLNGRIHGEGERLSI